MKASSKVKRTWNDVWKRKQKITFTGHILVNHLPSILMNFK